MHVLVEITRSLLPACYTLAEAVVDARNDKDQARGALGIGLVQIRALEALEGLKVAIDRSPMSSAARKSFAVVLSNAGKAVRLAAQNGDKSQITAWATKTSDVSLWQYIASCETEEEKAEKEFRALVRKVSRLTETDFNRFTAEVGTLRGIRGSGIPVDVLESIGFAHSISN
jgi:hypothetical protein